MKALLRKDYLIGGRYLLTVFITFLSMALFLRFSLGNESFEFISPMIWVGIGFSLGLLPDATDRAEAQSRWRTYARTLPYSRRDKVCAKYVFSLLAALAGTASVTLLMMMMLLHCSAFRVTAGAAITLITALNTSAFQYPLIFLRIRRGGSVLFNLIAAVLGIVYFLPQFVLLIAFFTAQARNYITPPHQLILYVPYIGVPVSLVIYLLSWLLTCRLYGCSVKKVYRRNGVSQSVKKGIAPR